MKQLRQVNKDYYSAGLLILLGAAVVMIGRGYGIGTLTRMGPGYIPIVLGVLLIVVGLLIGITASPAENRNSGHSGNAFELRSWSCIIAGVFAFVLLGTYGGLVPATFVSVVITAMGDRDNTIKDAALLAAAMVAAAVVIFGWGLKLQLPLFTWG